MHRPIRVDNSHPATVWDTARTLGVSKKRVREIIREVESMIHRNAKTGKVVIRRKPASSVTLRKRTQLKGGRKKLARHFALCIRNEGYAASLELRKIYQVLADERASEYGQLRAVDESGEDYLYPEEFFVRIKLPPAAERAILKPT